MQEDRIVVLNSFANSMKSIGDRAGNEDYSCALTVSYMKKGK